MNYIKKLYKSHQNNRKAGLIFISILTFWTLLVLLLPSLANPFYAVIYFTLITTIGFYFTLLLVLLLYLWAAGHFFENKLHKILFKNHIFRKICIIALGIIFLAQVSVLASNGNWIYVSGAFKNEMGPGSFGRTYINNGEWAMIDYSYWWTFGFIPFCVAFVLGAWYFIPLAMMLSMALIIYGTLSLYTKRYDVWNHWTEKTKKTKVSSIKIEDSDIEFNLDDNVKEFGNKLDVAQQKLVDDFDNYNIATPTVADEIQEAVRAREDLNNASFIRNEQERLNKLKEEIIKRRQQEKQIKTESSITENQKLALLRDWGEISPTAPSKSTLTKKDQEAEIFNNYELKPSTPVSFVETNIDEFSKAVNDDFNHELFEVYKKNGYEENVEIPLIESYAGDIFKEAEKTLNTTLNMNSKEELILHKEITAETIVDPAQHELMTIPIESPKEILDVVREAKEKVKKKLEQKINEKIVNENLMITNNLISTDWCQKYKKPQAYLLKEVLQTNDDEKIIKEETIIRSGQLDEMFVHFKIEANVKNYIIGPTLTTFEIAVQPNIKVKKILALEDNIKLILGVKNIRIQQTISTNGIIEIEIPNKIKNLIPFKELFEKNQSKKGELIIFLGENVLGKPLIIDLAKLPHLLIAGAPNSGKNSIINLILISLLMQYNPSELKLLLIDPKMNNFSSYREIPHLIAPVIISIADAYLGLKSIIVEIDNRCALMVKNNVRNILELNEILFAENKPKFSYLVVFINELADLMLVSPSIVEEAITQIIDKAEIAGVHLIIGTEKPVSNVVTKTIKTNIISKIALTVSTMIDSKIIFDNTGAEKLIGNGDMLLSLYGKEVFRAQGAYISLQEIKDIITFIKKQCKPYYQIDIKQQIGKKVLHSQFENSLDEKLYQKVYTFTVLNQKISINQIQKKYKVSYNKAIDIINALEQNGVIAPYAGSKTRNVLIKGDKND